VTELLSVDEFGTPPKGIEAQITDAAIIIGDIGQKR
jgi:hypothetical protein